MLEEQIAEKERQRQDARSHRREVETVPQMGHALGAPGLLGHAQVQPRQEIWGMATICNLKNHK